MVLLQLDSAHVAEKRRRPSPTLSFAARHDLLNGCASSRACPTWPLPPPFGPHLICSYPSPPMLGARGRTFLPTCSAPRQARQPKWYSPRPPRARPPGLCLPLLLLALCRSSPVFGLFPFFVKGFCLVSFVLSSLLGRRPNLLRF